MYIWLSSNNVLSVFYILSLFFEIFWCKNKSKIKFILKFQLFCACAVTCGGSLHLSLGQENGELRRACQEPLALSPIIASRGRCREVSARHRLVYYSVKCPTLERSVSSAMLLGFPCDKWKRNYWPCCMVDVAWNEFSSWDILANCPSLLVP